MRKFAFEMMFSEDRSTNDYVDLAVDDLSSRQATESRKASARHMRCWRHPCYLQAPH